MISYQVVLARSARKELQALHSVTAERILRKIESLGKEPRPDGCRKLRGSTDLWRIRVGVHRVIYQIDDEKRTIDIMIVRHRSDAYR